MQRTDQSLILRLQRGWELLQRMSDWFAAWFERMPALAAVVRASAQNPIKISTFFTRVCKVGINFADKNCLNCYQLEKIAKIDCMDIFSNQGFLIKVLSRFCHIWWFKIEIFLLKKIIRLIQKVSISISSNGCIQFSTLLHFIHNSLEFRVAMKTFKALLKPLEMGISISLRSKVVAWNLRKVSLLQPSNHN